MNRKDFAIALSLANLCFITVWLEILFLPLSAHFYMWAPSDRSYHLAIILNVCFLTGLFLLGIRVVRASGSRIAQEAAWGAFLCVLGLGLIPLRLSLPQELGVGRLLGVIRSVGLLIPSVFVGTVLAVVAIYFRRRLVKGVAFAVLILLPFAFLNLARVGYRVAFEEENGIESAPNFVTSPRQPSDNPTRVVVFVFDSLDQRLLFVERPDDVAVPNFDRFRAESLYASDAYSPGDSTILTMPSLISGQIVTDAHPEPPSDVVLLLKDSEESVLLSELPNLFQTARHQGCNTALVGWYLPYCRIPGISVDYCYWHPYFDGGSFQTTDRSIRSAMVAQWWTLVPWNNRRLHIQACRRLLEQAREVVTSDVYDFALV